MASNMTFGIFARDEASEIIDRVGAKFEGTGKKIENFTDGTTKSSRLFKKSTGEVAESTDQMATKASTAYGAMGALGSGLTLAGLDGSKAGTALMSAGLAFDAMSGITDSLTLALESERLKSIGSAIAAGASKVAHLAAAGASKAWAAAQWLLNAAMDANPIMLVVVAVAALVAAFVLAWRNSETFRRIITAAFTAVKHFAGIAFDWIKMHWPLLAGILTGGIYPAIQFIVRHWHDISNGFTAVKNWIVARWNDVVSFFRGIPGRIASVASGMWNSVKNALGSVGTWISGKFTGIVGWVKNMPGRIGAAARGMWDGIKDAFRDAINWIIDGWNGIQFKIPGFHVGPVHFGGFTLGLPDIPHLARGGITTGPTLALLGDNPGGREAIIPLPRNGAPGLGGPVVLEIRSGGAPLDDLIANLIRKYVRVNGGSVQSVFGRG